MSEGIKHDDGKAPFDLLPYKSLEAVSRVLDYGARRYGRFNWKKGMDWSRLISATYRHLGKFNNGEDVDSDTLESHLAHAACNMLFLLDYTINHPEKDDRYKDDKKTGSKRSRTLKIHNSVPKGRNKISKKTTRRKRKESKKLRNTSKRS